MSDIETIPLVSRGLYSIVSEVIGPDCIVKLRRDNCHIFNVMRNCPPSEIETVMSGSKAEGFDMKTSDVDIMYVNTNVLVIPSDRSVPAGYPPQKCVLTYETDCTSPGFAIIRCIYVDEINVDISTASILWSLIWNSIGPCVSSKRFVEGHLAGSQLLEIHGPCVSSTSPYGEFDFAVCLKCPYWPREASYFITRSMRTGWPSQQVVTDICNDGCLFVPIGSKALHCQDAYEMEWRMSFSLAEKKLTHSMNHCQFLCYGLLKLFLNEVLKKIENIQDLVCSYFLKTAVFWEISEDSSGWTPQNFKDKFWKTFCRLLKWVHVGYCPNFFNPDNNMFASKIHGYRQRLLMEALFSFHNEGIQFLLKCPSLNQNLSTILQHPKLAVIIPLNEELYVTQWYVEREKLNCIINLAYMCLRDQSLSKMLCELCYIQNVTATSTFMKTVLKHGETTLLQRIGECILAEVAKSNCRYVSNKAVKKHLYIALNILCRNRTLLCANQIILAKYFYILGLYNITINVLNNVKSRLQSSQFMYPWKANESDYNRLRRPDTSLESFLKSSIVDSVCITEETTISELWPEIKSCTLCTVILLFIDIPPLVFVNFLFFLSYHHLGDTIRRNDILRELHALMWYDEGYHISPRNRAISWEILGVCKQLCGDFHGAYQSYINALNDDCDYFKMATIFRIQSLTS